MNLPFERTWWIEPGKIIGGRYPGTPQPKESRQMREKLVTFGVRVFVNLQEPDETGGNGQTFPDYEAELQELAREHSAEVTCFRFPIQDNNIPTAAVMGHIQQVLHDAVAEGKLAYVHCWGGHGRTGTVAGCWMVENGLSAHEALKLITERRKHDPHLAKNSSPQMEVQRKLVGSGRGKEQGGGAAVRGGNSPDD